MLICYHVLNLSASELKSLIKVLDSIGKRVKLSEMVEFSSAALDMAHDLRVLILHIYNIMLFSIMSSTNAAIKCPVNTIQFLTKCHPQSSVSCL